jgi:hypothetical protein
MWKKVLMFVISSGLAASAWKALDARLRRERVTRQRQLDHQQIRRWEDEGGSVAPPAPPP